MKLKKKTVKLQSTTIIKYKVTHNMQIQQMRDRDVNLATDKKTNKKTMR